MPFLTVNFYNYRNLKNTRIDLAGREVYFVGENGQGKSNLLESLYFTSYGISFRTHTDSQIIRNGEKSFSLSALYKKSENDTQQVRIIFENNKKRIEKNGKKINDRKELINTIPCILFCHDDLRFATGDPEDKRFFIDQSLTLFDSLYIDDLRNYKKILKSRNIILKEHKYELLEVYDQQLVNFGLIIQAKRKKAIFQFNQIFSKLYEDISGITNLKISYEPSWKEITEGLALRTPGFDEVIIQLKNKQEADKSMETTLSGPHRDKINFVKDGNLFVPTASTGQCRLISLILRVAQAIFYTQVTGMKPVLLMDDVLLELDPAKRTKLTALLPDYDQLFCTFLPGEPYENYMKPSTQIFFVENGEWKEAKK
ncbi:MAG: DNA replication/repair protein RecF [Clostridia bacterium]|nr:DNA replication/repair protein RecF [Clostridia bacterium]